MHLKTYIEIIQVIDSNSVLQVISPEKKSPYFKNEK